MLALNFVRPNLKTFAAGAGGYVALWLIGIVVAPYCVQKFIVQPNELALETPYLSIQLTIRDNLTIWMQFRNVLRRLAGPDA